jgi:hypothetical protein
MRVKHKSIKNGCGKYSQQWAKNRYFPKQEAGNVTRFEQADNGCNTIF